MSDEIYNRIFKAYDIRGKYPTEINKDFAVVLGNGFGSFVGAGKKVVVGRDVRSSSKELSDSLISGLNEAGVDAIDIGIVPTPIVYFAISKYMLDGGVIVTASHNPKEWNGFIVCNGEPQVIGMGLGLEKILELIKRKDFSLNGGGSSEDYSSKALEDYESFLKGKANVKKKMKIGIDPGNGACSEVAKRMLSGVGIECHAINDIADGEFSKRPPEPKPEYLSEIKELVVINNLDFGVAYDGDGDRAIFIDNNGNVLRGEIPIAVFAKNYIRSGEKGVYEVSCSNVVEEMIKLNGGIPLLSRVGHSFIIKKMREESAKFGGEISGHIYFDETNYVDDAIFATVKMAELLSESDRKFSDVIKELPRYLTLTKEFEVDDGIKYLLIEMLKSSFEGSGYRIITIDGVKAVSDKGWFIIRASNTTPIVRLTAESKNKEILDAIVDFAESKLREKIAEIGR